MTELPATTALLTRGLARKCPHCGEGALFAGYLKRHDFCPVCGESFDGLDADDGPAWLTIGIVAHIVVPLLILMETKGALSYGAEIVIVVATTVILSLAVLPLCKGLFIAALWRIRRGR